MSTSLMFQMTAPEMDALASSYGGMASASVRCHTAHKLRLRPLESPAHLGNLSTTLH